MGAELLFLGKIVGLHTLKYKMFPIKLKKAVSSSFRKILHINMQLICVFEFKVLLSVTFSYFNVFLFKRNLF